MIIRARDRDLGGFSVRRLLPAPTRHMVGPFIFFDHMGSAQFPAGQGMDVRPHPHIGLATVTYLFEGGIFHRDSLGSAQEIAPGDINWMTAGKGIVHSERTPKRLRDSGFALNGIQCWVALPENEEETSPEFIHYPSAALPVFQQEKFNLKLLLGQALGQKSPVKVHSDLFYLEARCEEASDLNLPEDSRERGIYVVKGSVFIDGDEMEERSLIILKAGQKMKVEARSAAHMMFFGGEPVGPRLIWWNLVASTSSKLEAAKEDWKLGPRAESSRFIPVPGDDQEFIPSPLT